jgi:hypothetical protein
MIIAFCIMTHISLSELKAINSPDDLYEIKAAASKSSNIRDAWAVCYKNRGSEMLRK